MVPLVLTQGDPAGVGPELLLRVAQAGLVREGDRVFADPDALAQLAARLAGQGAGWAGDALAVLRGHLDPECRPALGQFEALRLATDHALAACARGEPIAMVTAPIDKAIAHAEGLRYPGHTEYLAARCGTDRFAMLMLGTTLRVALVTIHLPLREVAASLRSEDIVRVGLLLADALAQWPGVPARIGVLALNPHAGEKGHLGDEEGRVIEPAIAQLSRARPQIAFVGPLPADTAFTRQAQGELGALVAMYHDQALGPFKLLHFVDGINVTLGLPFRRASPDHGTARDLAGRGLADARSMLAAVAYARAGVA